MTLKLGRVGTDISLGDPASWSRSGNQVTLSGELGAGVTPLADCITLTEQILGLVNNPDEPVIACTWTQEAWFDGFYRVLAVNVDTRPVSLNIGYFPYTIQLERVADGASPRIDMSIIGALLQNGNSMTTADPTVWAPAALTYGFVLGGQFVDGALLPIPFSATTGGSLSASRTSDTGAVNAASRTAKSGVTNAYATFEVPPASYYNGGCLIRSGTTLRRVVGSRMKSLPVNWEIGNGLIRVTPTTLARFITEVYDGTVWEDAKTWHFIGASTGNVNFFSTSTGWGDVSVLRNSPEECSIRLSARYLGGQTDAQLKGTISVDLSLRRGDRHLSIYVWVEASAGGLLGTVGVAQTSAEAGNAGVINGAMRASSNDADGNRYVVSSAAIYTADTVNAGVCPNVSALSSRLMVGYELGGSSATGLNTAQAVVNQWYYPISERMTARGR